MPVRKGGMRLTTSQPDLSDVDTELRISVQSMKPTMNGGYIK